MGLSGSRLCVDSNSLTPLGPIPKQNQPVLFYSNNFTQFCKWLVKWLGRAFHVSDTLAAQVFKGPASLSPVSRRPSACAWLARADRKGGAGRVAGGIFIQTSHKGT